MYIAPARACTLACSVHWPRNQRHTPASSHGPMHARRRCHGALECTRAHAAADPCPARQPLAAARRRDRLRGRSSRRGGQPAPELAARDVRARLPPPLGPGSAPAASAPPARATRAPPARPVAHRLLASGSTARSSAAAGPRAGCGSPAQPTARSRRAGRLGSALQRPEPRRRLGMLPRAVRGLACSHACNPASGGAAAQLPAARSPSDEFDGAMPPSSLDAAPAPPRRRRWRQKPIAAAAAASRLAAMSQMKPALLRQPGLDVSSPRAQRGRRARRSWPVATAQLSAWSQPRGHFLVATCVFTSQKRRDFTSRFSFPVLLTLVGGQIFAFSPPPRLTLNGGDASRGLMLGGGAGSVSGTLDCHKVWHIMDYLSTY